MPAFLARHYFRTVVSILLTQQKAQSQKKAHLDSYFETAAVLQQTYLLMILETAEETNEKIKLPCHKIISIM